MLPFQTLLVLLALLMTVGCSQKAPPHTQAEQNATRTIIRNTGDNIDTGSDQPSDADSGTHDLAQGETGASLVADGNWAFHLDGEGAQKLFEAMGIPEVDGKKTGLQYECEHHESRYRCTVILSAADGGAKKLISNGDLKAAEPTFKPTELYRSKYGYLEIDPYQKKDPKTGAIQTSPFARVLLQASLAQKIFDDLSVVARQDDLPATTVDGNDYVSGTEKYGTNVWCAMRVLKNDGKTRHYWCKLYLNTSSGSIDLIQLPQ